MPQYCNRANLNLYDSPELERLATQATVGRHLRVLSNLPEARETEGAIAVCLCEDDYAGWLAPDDLCCLEVAPGPYHAPVLTEDEVRARVPGAIAFIHQAMSQPNQYLWGGTVGPDYDCSGLMQTAFASMGIWLPRDAYQQEAFVQTLAPADLEPGDLVFFGPPEKATHVGLYLGDGCYVHSSGKEHGRNGIGIDRLSEDGDAISYAYYQQFRGAGRVVCSYQPWDFGEASV